MYNPECPKSAPRFEYFKTIHHFLNILKSNSSVNIHNFQAFINSEDRGAASLLRVVGFCRSSASEDRWRFEILCVRGSLRPSWCFGINYAVDSTQQWIVQCVCFAVVADTPKFTNPEGRVIMGQLYKEVIIS